MNEPQAAPARKRGGRRRSAGREAAPTQTANWPDYKTPPTVSMGPVNILSDHQIDAIEATAFRILDEIGMDFLDPDACEIFRRAGARVEGERVKLSRELVENTIKTAPASITVHGRNPRNTVEFAPGRVNFAMVASTPNASDLDGGRRPGNYEDYQNFIRLGHQLDIIHLFGGYPVEPTDIAPAIRHLHCLRDILTFSEKAFNMYALGQVRITDGAMMTQIAHGLTEAEMQANARIFTVINTSSPLRLDGPMIRGAMEMAKWGQVNVVTPFTLAGAMAPVTLPGALAQQHAEALGTFTLLQLAYPGSPMVYGGFTSNVDMKSGAPAFGTPENVNTALIGGQLARRINIPYRSSGSCAANAVDAQAAYETMNSLWGSVLGGATLIKHAAGWLEGGLCASFEKVIVDAEMLQSFSYMLQPLQVDDETLAFSAQQEIEPGGHFFGTQHTLQRYQSAFNPPLVSDWRNFESWQEAGAPEAAEHANRIYKQLLAEFQQPDMPPSIRADLDAFIARRIDEGGIVGEI